MTLLPIVNKVGAVVAHSQVDEGDWPLVDGKKWTMMRSGYVVWWDGATKKNVYLHRHLLGLTFGDGRYADHINRDPLDNRRSNLRIATASENLQNTRLRSDNKSGHRGVTWDCVHDKWLAQVKVKGKVVFGRTFDTVEEAGAAAAAARARLHPFSPAAPSPTPLPT